MRFLNLKLAGATLLALAAPALASAQPYFADHGRGYGYERGHDSYRRDGEGMWGRRFEHRDSWRHGDRFDRGYRWGQQRHWRADSYRDWGGSR